MGWVFEFLKRHTMPTDRLGFRFRDGVKEGKTSGARSRLESGLYHGIWIETSALLYGEITRRGRGLP